MYEPNFTVIIPTYNIVEEGKVSEFDLMLELLNMQTYPFVEVLVMDNNSQDGTVDLLKDYKNEEMLAFFSAPDQGKFDAINKGLMRAKGKYVSFLSCDDFYHDIMAINDVVTSMESTNADFCCFTSYCRNDDGSAFEFEPSLLSTFQAIPCPRQAVIFKKDTISQLGYFDSKFKLLADYDLLIRLILGGYAGTVFNANLVTTKLASKVEQHQMQTEAELNHIFYKNYKNLYPLNDEILDRMVKLGEIPKPLLDKFASYFPQDSSDEFYEKYQNIYNFKYQSMQNQ